MESSCLRYRAAAASYRALVGAAEASRWGHTGYTHTVPFETGHPGDDARHATHRLLGRATLPLLLRQAS
jgi:hypothetical protein